MQVIREWFQRNLSDPQVVILTLFLLVGTLIILFVGQILAPVLASIIIAYLLEGIVGAMVARRAPRMLAILVVFSLFIAFQLIVLFMLLPMLSRQIGQVVGQLPAMINWVQMELMQLPERYPEVISREQVLSFIEVLRQELGRFGQLLLSLSMASLRGLITLLVYLVLMPLLVFFFLKDKKVILSWSLAFLPEDRRLTTEVWREVDRQIGNYIRGKFWEILIVWSVTSVVFSLLGLEFAMLIGFFVGLSVLIPYIGVTIMTLPVAIMGYFQLGFSSAFAYIIIAYFVIQLLDGNLLAPLLLSGVINLHPVAIIVSVLVFGGVWGFWGVFFAIPLATLVQAVLRAWPRQTAPYGRPSPPIP